MGLKQNKPLQKKTPLKAKTTLKPAKVTKKQQAAEISLLKKSANTLFSHYVRLRDAELYGNIGWQSECISCGRVNIVRWYDEDKKGKDKWRWSRKEEAGHFVTRTNWFLKFNEYNVNGQCVYCNRHLSGNAASYHKALDAKYGDGTALELIELAHTHKDYKITKEELENVIKASKEYLEWAYSMERQVHEEN